MNKSAVNTVIDALGVAAICQQVGVGEHSVRAAKSAGEFPASWFNLLEEMCVLAGCPCPREAFSFKGPKGSNLGADNDDDSSASRERAA